ncbi:zinc finger protein Paris [Drosophila bipectinata]|uniref:zinc finger protein Paris n=1 Tax=Drosophila bipectinata TaxID=42026 RepID=UPI0038B3D9AF
MALKRTNLKLVELLQPEEVKVNSAPTSDTAFSEEDFTSDEEKSQEYNNNHTENRCRICYRMLGPDSNDKDLCADENNVLLYYIELIAGVRIQREDGMPNRICSNCHGSLQKAMEFRSNCLKTEFRLKQAKGETFRYESQLSDDDIETELENVLYEESAQNICESSVLDEGSGSDIDLFTDEDEEESDPKEKDTEVPEDRMGIRQPKHKCNEISRIVPCASKEEVGNLDRDGRVYKVVLNECNRKEEDSETALKIKPSKLSIEEINKRRREKHKSKPHSFVCHKCGNSYRLASHLENHMLRHNNEKNFQCPECPRKFYVGYDCNMHIRVRHRGEKPFTCNHCSECFSSPGLRQRHEKKVHGAGPRVVMTRFNKAKVPPDEEEKNGRYFCSECPKSYTSRFSLKVHKNSHTGAKPFKCNVCQQAFRGPGLLRRHMEIHKKLPFHCEICLKGFLLKCQLKDHMLVHTGKRSFWCELCDVYYRYRYNLTKHQKSSLHLDNLLKRSETESQDL